jgi:hypothetical protein
MSACRSARLDRFRRAGRVRQTHNAGGSQRSQVRREPLHVDEGVAALAQPLEKGGQRDFRRVGRTMKHRFAEERRAERDPVQSADQGAGLPGFDAMGVPVAVQL